MKPSTPKTELPLSTHLPKALFGGSLVFYALIFTALSTLANPKIEYGKIEVLRDTWGIPHLFSDTDAGAMYGLGLHMPHKIVVARVSSVFRVVSPFELYDFDHVGKAGVAFP